jgi:hypothetical protein
MPTAIEACGFEVWGRDARIAALESETATQANPDPHIESQLDSDGDCISRGVARRCSDLADRPTYWFNGVAIPYFSQVEIVAAGVLRWFRFPR